MKHTIAVVGRAVREGRPLHAATLLCRILRSQLFIQRYLIFALDLSERVAIPRELPAGFEVARYQHWDRIPPTLRETLRQHATPLHWSSPPCDGASLWAGSLNGQLTTVAITVPASGKNMFCRPVPRDSTLICHCITLPGFRGGGLAVALWGFITTALAAEAVSRVYCFCQDWNDATIRANRRLGFELIDKVWVKPRDRNSNECPSADAMARRRSPARSPAPFPTGDEGCP